MFLILFASFTSAQFEWNTYCNAFTPCWNGQFETAYGRFDAGINNDTMSNGYETSFGDTGSFLQDFPFQPLVTHFNFTGADQEYLIFPNGNFLQVYDSSLNIRQEINTGGHAVSQIDTLNWDADDEREIAGIWEIDGSNVAFKVYDYNITSNSFTLIHQQNFSTTIRTGFAGVKHSDNNAYFIVPYSNVGGLYQMNFTQINSSGIYNELFLNRTCTYDEPIAWTDMDADGDVEFLTYCEDEVIVFEEDGTIDFNITERSGYKIRDARMVKADATNQWKIAVSENKYEDTYITMWKLDETKLWENHYTGTGDAGQYGRLAIGTYYYTPNWFQRWILGEEAGLETSVFVGIFESRFTTIYLNDFIFLVLEADDGGEIESKSWTAKSGWGTRGYEGSHSLTIVDINHNGVYDFVYSHQDGYIIYDPDQDSILVEVGSGTIGADRGYESCIPADLYFDNQQEIICSGEDTTIVYYSSYVNQNAEIVSVAYDPSTTIQVNTTLYMYVTATDLEDDSPLYYKSKCNETADWSAETTTPTLSCFYGSLGIFENTIAVRDPYHSDYDTFSQDIIVTSTGVICDNDGICEAEQGEDYLNCPNDCVSPPDTTTSSVEGSLTLPTELVDTENTNQGLLPEIYYGTLGFMSSVLSPLIILVFLFLFVMIMITIGIIIKKIAGRVASAGR